MSRKTSDTIRVALIAVVATAAVRFIAPRIPGVDKLAPYL